MVYVTNSAMHKLARLQLVGPFVLLCAVAAAEAAAYALANAPSSAFLWYLDLEVFSIFRKPRSALGDYSIVQLLIAAALVALAMAGLALRRNLLVAISSNLSFVYAGFLFLSWQYWNGLDQVKSASLAWVQVPAGDDRYFFFAILLLTSFVSFAASHFFYVRLLHSRDR